MKTPLLDLHGRKPDEVFDMLDRFLMEQGRRGSARVRIMTGKGSGAVKKTVIDYLKKGQFPWEYEKMPNGSRNEGVLIVILD